MGCDSEVARHRKCYSGLYVSLCTIVSILTHKSPGKALASRLDVPLPYLLYRAQTRYEQDLRGLQDIGGALSPPSLHIDTTITEGTPRLPDRLVSLRRQTLRGGVSPISSPSRLGAPLGVRARLNSLGTNSPARLNRVSSSSILTLQGHRKESGGFRPTSPLSSGSESDENEIANKEEEAERQLGEQEELDNKLKALEQMMTDENLGLVSSLRGKTKGKGKEVDRGRVGTPSTSSLRRDIIQERPRHGTMSSSASRQSLSSASSPPGSIPSMPSPPPDSQSPMSRHFSPGKSRSPPSVSTRNVRGHSHMRLNGLVMTGKASEKGSNHGSSASSFSDISGG